MNQFNVPVNPVSVNMLALWPGRTGGAVAQNFVSTDANTYSSANGIAKVEIALAQGKKVWDRRQDERAKEARREAEEAIYRNRRR